MKKTLFAVFLALATFCLIGCEKSNETGLAKPSGLRVYQDEQTLVLEWNAVKNAKEYSLSKNGYFWQVTSSTSAIDYQPEEGNNTYEVVAINANEESDPATVSYYFTPSGGGGGGGEETPAYYIKHPWGSGSDSSWEWKAMTKEGNNYTYTGEWGGVGANINTIADDNGASWFAASSISGASGLSLGTTVKFIYNPSASSLSVEIGGQGGGGQQETTAFYIKHPWGGNDWTWQPMTKSGNSYSYTGVWGGVGANINSSASDSGAEWYEKSKISGASSVSVGETVTFTFVSSDGPVGSLSVSKNSGGGGGSSSKPSAPTNVSATVSSSCIEVTWNSVSGADSYNVYRATSASGTYSYKGNTSSTYYSDCSVTAGTTYYYKVTAENSAGESAKSAYAYAKVPTSGGGGGDNPGGGGGTTPTKPSAPTGLKATQNGEIIQLTWNAVSNATKYYIYRSTSSYSGYTLIDESYTNSFDDNYSFMSGTTYYYKVSAVNMGGESSQSSYAYCKFERAYAPCPPQNVSVTKTYSSSVKIKWDVSSATGCGKPTKQVILLWNASTYQWVEKTPSTSSSGGSYEILSSYLSQYIDLLNELVFIIKLENAEGTEMWEFTYNYEQDQITNYQQK